jgi:hypothetical protein
MPRAPRQGGWILKPLAPAIQYEVQEGRTLKVNVDGFWFMLNHILKRYLANCNQMEVQNVLGRCYSA